MRRAEHVARTEEKKNSYNIFGGKPKGKRPYSQDLGVDERIILDRILGEQSGKLWIGCIWLRIGNSGRILLTRQLPFRLHTRQVNL
jgi:hypothetical protein